MKSRTWGRLLGATWLTTVACFVFAPNMNALLAAILFCGLLFITADN